MKSSKDFFVLKEFLNLFGFVDMLLD